MLNSTGVVKIVTCSEFTAKNNLLVIQCLHAKRIEHLDCLMDHVGLTFLMKCYELGYEGRSCAKIVSLHIKVMDIPRQTLIRIKN